MLGIVVSRTDSVAERIWEQLRALASWSAHEDPSRADADGGGEYYRTDGAVLRTFDEAHLRLERPETAFDADLGRLVFPSRHAGDTGPLLTTHFTGNVGAAEHGGRDRELARAAPLAAKRALGVLDRQAPDDYEVSLECTHHGPSAIEVPSLYVELGSEDAQWRDDVAARAVARAVLACRNVGESRGANGDAEADSMPTPVPLPGHRVVGIGGGHYAPRFTRIARETSWAVGHIAADWGLDQWDAPDSTVLEQLFAHSGAEIGLLAEDRPAIEACLEGMGYRLVDETWLRATSGVALPLLAACERRLGSIEEGLRLGTPARTHTRRSLDRPTKAATAVDVGLPDSATVSRLPTALLDAAAGIDLGRTLDAVSESAIAYQTTEAGNRPAGKVLLEDPAAESTLNDGLATVLERKYDRVERTTEAVIAERSVFDPERAATLGVPEGPAFGRLASGESVTVDGREIDPAVVSTTERRRFPL